MSEYKLLEKTYDELLAKLIKLVGDRLHDLTIRFETIDGTTITFSWSEREKRLEIDTLPPFEPEKGIGI